MYIVQHHAYGIPKDHHRISIPIDTQGYMDNTLMQRRISRMLKMDGFDDIRSYLIHKGVDPKILENDKTTEEYN